MAPVTLPPAAPRPPQTPPAVGAAAAPSAVASTAPASPSSPAARPSEGDSFTREPWAFSPVRPQIPGQDGAPPLWALPGGAGTLSGPGRAPAAGPAAGPGAPTSPAGGAAAPDPAATAYAQKLADIFGASPEAFAKGQLPTTGPLTDAQKDRLVGATQDYLLGAKVGTLAGPAGDRVRAALTARGIDPRTVEGKSLRELGAGVGEAVARDVARGVREDPASAAPLVAAGLATAAGAAVATAADKGLTVPAVSGKIGPVTVTGQGSIEPGFRGAQGQVDAKGTVPLGGGRTLDVSGGVAAGTRGVDRGQASATYRGPLGSTGSVTVTGTVAVDRATGPSASASAVLEPARGGPKIVVSGSADGRQQSGTVGIGGTF